MRIERTCEESCYAELFWFHILGSESALVSSDGYGPIKQLAGLLLEEDPQHTSELSGVSWIGRQRLGSVEEYELRVAAGQAPHSSSCLRGRAWRMIQHPNYGVLDGVSFWSSLSNLKHRKDLPLTVRRLLKLSPPLLFEATDTSSPGLFGRLHPFWDIGLE